MSVCVNVNVCIWECLGLVRVIWGCLGVYEGVWEVLEGDEGGLKARGFLIVFFWHMGKAQERFQTCIFLTAQNFHTVLLLAHQKVIWSVARSVIYSN